jgi:hypothetical protein
MRPTQGGGGRIFVGREDERRAFAAALSEIAQAPNRSSLWGKTEAPRSQPRVFLVEGSAAIRKSSLLSKFADQCAAPLEPVQLEVRRRRHPPGASGPTAWIAALPSISNFCRSAAVARSA